MIRCGTCLWEDVGKELWPEVRQAIDKCNGHYPWSGPGPCPGWASYGQRIPLTRPLSSRSGRQKEVSNGD